MNRQTIAVTSRDVRKPGSTRWRRAYSACGCTLEGVHYDVVDAPSEAVARRLAREQIAFKTANPPIKIDGFELWAQGDGEFGFMLPGSYGSMLFAARSSDAALARLALEWRERDDVLEFVRAALER